MKAKYELKLVVEYDFSEVPADELQMNLMLAHISLANLPERASREGLLSGTHPFWVDNTIHEVRRLEG